MRRRHKTQTNDIVNAYHVTSFSQKKGFCTCFAILAHKYTAFPMKRSNFILYRAILRKSYYQQNPKTKIQTKERQIMTNTKNGSNQGMVPEARAAMDRFKMEAAAEVGVNLKQGYNGDLTSRQAGSIGGQMVKKMIESYEQNLASQG